jgi:hypothetical protein
MPDEQIFHGTAEALLREAERLKLKGEFVIVIEGVEGIGASDAKSRDTRKKRLAGRR